MLLDLTPTLKLGLTGLLALALACGGAWTYNTGRTHGAASVQAQWDKARAQATKEYEAKLNQARSTERDLQDQLEKLRKEKADEKARADVRYRALLDSVRNRPERPPEVAARPEATSAGPGATGAQLYREDAEFLIGEARRADNLRASLQECRAAYENARRKLN